MSSESISKTPIAAMDVHGRARQRNRAAMFGERISSLSPARRRALQFGIETGLNPAQIVVLGWKEAYRIASSPAAQAILREQPLHPGSPTYSGSQSGRTHQWWGRCLLWNGKSRASVV